MAKYFIIAGEASGDQHAGALMEQISLRDPEAHWAGLGGDRMASAGCRLYQDYRQMAYMGFVAVLRNLGKVRSNLRIAREALLSERPDVLILVDYPSFNLRIAAYCRRHLPQTRIIYYIPPKVWAWKSWRIHRIARLCDQVWGIFPFETDYYSRRGYQCTYVGNPTAKAIDAYLQQTPPCTREAMIALLPGSRPAEVSSCLPVMLEAARRIAGYRIEVTAAPGIEDGFYTPYMREGETLSRHTYDTVCRATAAVVNSGTATLETALLGCPQVAVYQIHNPRLMGMIRWAQPLFFSIRHFTLVNILAEEELIAELVANDFTADRIEQALRRLLTDEAYKKYMLAGYEHISDLLHTEHATISDLLPARN